MLLVGLGVVVVVVAVGDEVEVLGLGRVERGVDGRLAGVADGTHRDAHRRVGVVGLGLLLAVGDAEIVVELQKEDGHIGLQLREDIGVVEPVVEH